MFGPGDRMGRDEMNIARQMRRHLADDGALDRADVGHDRAGFEERCDLLSDRAAGADRDAEDHEVGVLDGFRVGLQHAVDDGEFGHPRAGLLERAVVTISLVSPCARAARAIEPPIRPKLISATRRKIGVVFIWPP